ncbi:hypothetical protein IAT40_005064 [Kwoniella sp. CBS 6097]
MLPIINMVFGLPLFASILTLGSVSVSAVPSQLQLQLRSQQPFETPGEPSKALDDLISKGNDRVNVSLYVMSRCPDARLCESVFQQVLKTDGILDKINFDVGYIGTLNKSEPLGVTCKHGPLECLGNAHQLCLFNHLPVSKFSAVLDCQNYPSSFPGNIGTIESVKGCVDTVGVDWVNSGVGACIEGKTKTKSHTEGLPFVEETFDGETNTDEHQQSHEEKEPKLGEEAQQLLKESIRSTNEKGISTSCTIDIASTIVKGGQRRCVVDSGVWRGCDDGHTAQDFVRVIEAEYKNL